MTKRTKTVEFESDRQYDDPDDPDAGGDGGHEEQQPTRDPNQPREYTVLTNSARFKKDQFVMRAADVPKKPEPEPEGDIVVCFSGDIVRLTDAEAEAKRAGGVGLADPPDELYAEEHAA